MSVLQNFLQMYKNLENVEISNTGLPPMYGRYTIPKENYEDFLRKYSECILNGEKLYLTELHSGASPVLIDLDFKFNIDVGVQRRYDDDMITKIVEIYNSVLKIFFNIDESNIEAYVFEKPNPTKQNGYIKDGIHIMYPNIVSKPEVQYEIRKKVVDKCKTLQIFKNMENLNSVEQIIDEAVIKASGWLMYGSCKQDRDPYELTKILNFECKQILMPQLSIFDKVKTFSIRKNENECTQLAKSVSKEPIQINTESTIEGIIDSEICIAENLVKILSNDRCDDRSSWLDVGICLFNIDSSLLESWIEFSKRSTKYKNGECQKQWKSFSKYVPKLTIASLHHWAKIDNPKQYDQVRSRQLSSILFNSLDGKHYDIAQYVHKRFAYQFVCSSLKFNQWYVFHNHTWQEMEKGKTLRNLLSTVVSKEYKKLESYFKKKSLENPEDQELLEKTKQCDKLAKSLKDSKFKDAVMKECEYLFDDPEFAKKLDSNIDLLGFNNGIYDLKSLQFRDGRFEDYVSFTTRLDYIEYDPDSESSKDMLDFLSKVLPQADVRNFVLRLGSSMLSGKTEDQKFPIWTGDGSNGKSKLMDLIEVSLGDYFQKLPVTVLTHKRAGSSSANPEIAKSKGKRIISFQEPEKDDKINVGFMKELTGGDTIMAREMYKSPVEFKPQFKLILCCNDLPDIPSRDNGTWRRIRVVNFPSKFVDEPEKENEYKIDRSIPQKLKLWSQSFIALLINTYPLYLKEGLCEPECVLLSTSKYKDKGDHIKKFIEENIEITGNDKDRIGAKALYDVYKQWHTDSMNYKAPSRTEFREYSDSLIGEPCKKKGYRGIVLKVQEEEEIEC